MQQAEDLANLLRCLRSALPTVSFGMFTGYSEKELDTGRYFTRHGVDRDRRRTLWRLIRSHLDFAVMGRYNRLQPSDAPMCSSANHACVSSAPVTPKSISASKPWRSPLRRT